MQPISYVKSETFLNMNNVITILEKDRLVDKPEIGQKYHVNWANLGCFFILKSFKPNYMCEIITPKTKKVYTTSVSSLRLLNRLAIQKAIKRMKDAQTELKLFP